jgi:hypothetical protein
VLLSAEENENRGWGFCRPGKKKTKGRGSRVERGRERERERDREREIVGNKSEREKIFEIVCDGYFMAICVTRLYCNSISKRKSHIHCYYWELLFPY